MTEEPDYPRPSQITCGAFLEPPWYARHADVQAQAPWHRCAGQHAHGWHFDQEGKRFATHHVVSTAAGLRCSCGAPYRCRRTELPAVAGDANAKNTHDGRQP